MINSMINSNLCLNSCSNSRLNSNSQCCKKNCCDIIKTNICYDVKINPDIIFEILYDLHILYININEHKYFKDTIFGNIEKIEIANVDGKKNYIYDKKYIFNEINGIYYLVIGNIKYFKNNGKYYKMVQNNIIIDDESTYFSLNELAREKSIIITLLESIGRIINTLIRLNGNYFKLIDNTMHILNCQLKTIKIINLSYFFYITNSQIYLKEYWTLINENFISSSLNNIIYLIQNFKSLLKLTNIK